MPGASLKPYDALFAASQRARNPVGAAAGAASDIPISHDLLAAGLHAAIPVGIGAGIGGVAGAVAPLPKRKERDEYVGGSALRGGIIAAPLGYVNGLEAYLNRYDARQDLADADKMKAHYADPQSRIIEELRNEFPELKDRGIAAKIHPDARGATEAPHVVLDDAFDFFSSAARGAGGKGKKPPRASPKLDFLRSWRRAL